MSGSGCRKAHGEAASTKLNTVTHPYYDGTLTAFTPAVDHGQDSDRGGRCGLRLSARVRKVNNLTPPRKKTTPYEPIIRYRTVLITVFPFPRRASADTGTLVAVRAPQAPARPQRQTRQALRVRRPWPLVNGDTCMMCIGQVRGPDAVGSAERSIIIRRGAQIEIHLSRVRFQRLHERCIPTTYKS